MAASKGAIIEAFIRFDVGGSGVISCGFLRALCREVQGNADGACLANVDEMITEAGIRDSGVVDYRTFVSWLYEESDLTYQAFCDKQKQISHGDGLGLVPLPVWTDEFCGDWHDVENMTPFRIQRVGNHVRVSWTYGEAKPLRYC